MDRQLGRSSKGGGRCRRSDAREPGPTVLSYAAGREPKELDAARAAEIDRSLRITLLHPPHGRADLALTFTNTLHRLDRLHDIVAIVDTGLLPPLIGDVRLKPSPEKQGSE